VANRTESRRTVTVVFTDVTGSTGLGESLDPEAVRRVMERYFETASAVLVRHGGTVEKFIGDAVMAVFGAPRLHEDDALRAARAAVEMRTELAALNEELERDWGVRLRTRTGVNTGEVVAGDPSSGQALVTGDAVNTAARLEQMAGPDEILIGEATHALTANATRAEPVEPLQARGKRAPVAAWRLLEVHGDDPYLRRLDTPLVGRHEELAQLGDVYTRAVRQRSCALFTLIGPAGIGKSRLTLEFVRSVQDEARVLTGRCLPYGEGSTYWPLAEIVRGLGGDDVQGTIAGLLADDPERERVAALVASLVGQSEVTADTDDVGWAMRRLLEALAGERPLVVSLEDVNWAEPTLLDLIEQIAEWSREAPIMILCSARDELIELRPTWAGGLRNATTALLEPLSATDSVALIDHLASDQRIDQPTARRVASMAAGNPLFVEQLLATVGAGQQLDVTALSTIHAVISARLDALSTAERTVIECASVMGKEFSSQPLDAMLAADAGDPAVAETLARLARKDLIRPTRSPFHAGGAYRFGHLLVRDAAYARLPKRRRADLHERFAGWIGASGPAHEAELSEVIGYHLEQAHQLRTELGPLDEAGRGLALDAGRALVAAGLRAQRRMDTPAAVNLLGRAAALLTDQPDARSEVLPELALANVGLPDLPRAREVLDEALDAALAAGDTRGEQRALLAHAHALWTSTGSVGPLAHAAKRAIPVFEQAGDDRWLVRAWLWRAFAHQGESRYGPAAVALEQARSHLSATGGMAEERSVFGNLALSLWLGPVSCDEAIARCRQLIASERERHSAAEAYVTVPLAMLLASIGRLDEAYAVLETASELLDRVPSVTRTEISLFTGLIHLMGGDPERAERNLRAALEPDRPFPEQISLCETAAGLANCLVDLGTINEAARWAETSRTTAAADDLGNQIAWRTAVARVDARRDGRRAGPIAHEAVELAERTDSPSMQGDALMALAEVQRLTGDSDAARSAAERALERYRSKGITASAGRAQTLLGALAAGEAARR
jgi:class 3 adenylate cyclase/tetratricopeptide (TPR) repeat protein